MAISCKRAGERLTPGVLRAPSPAHALRILDQLLLGFAYGDQLFITARCHDSTMSMWTTGSRAAGLYWCAAALTQLWGPEREATAALRARIPA